jgi:hypothetical protein
VLRANEGHGGWRFRERFKLNALAAVGGQTALAGHFTSKERLAGEGGQFPRLPAPKEAPVCHAFVNPQQILTRCQLVSAMPGGVCDRNRRAIKMLLTDL